MSFLINATTKVDADRLVRLSSGATGSRPASPTVGMMFFNTTTGAIEIWNGTAWKAGISTPGVEISPLWSWGRNNYGQLGDGTTSNRSSPVSVVGGFTDWTKISSQAAIRSNGTLWAWGFNTNGQLGDGTTSSRSSPVSVIGGFTDWTEVCANFGHTAAIRSNGTAWAWGANSYGRLGDGTTSSRSSPVSVIGGFTDWTKVSGGSNFTAAIRSNGTAWGWGRNNYGQLGNGTTTNTSSPVSVVGGFTDWIQISAGQLHTCTIRANGTAWCWGYSGVGRLGDGALFANRSSPVSVVGGFTNWTKISGGLNHTAAIRSNGTAWTWGSNDWGQLGDGTTGYKNSPVSVVGGFTDWVQIQANIYFTTAIRSNGTLWAWGFNTTGQLGDGTTSTRLSPVSVVGGFTDWHQLQEGFSNSTIARRIG